MRSSGFRLFQARSVLVAIAWVSLAVLLQSGAHAQTWTKELADVNGWKILILEQPQAEVDPLCGIRTPAIDDAYLQISNLTAAEMKTGRKGAAFFSFYTKEVELSADRTPLLAKVSIDGREIWEGDLIGRVANDAGQTALVGTIGDDVLALVKPLGYGRSLSLDLPDRNKTISVSLSGSTAALREFDKCLQRVRIAPEG